MHSWGAGLRASSRAVRNAYNSVRKHEPSVNESQDSLIPQTHAPRPSRWLCPRDGGRDYRYAPRPQFFGMVAESSEHSAIAEPSQVQERGVMPHQTC